MASKASGALVLIIEKQYASWDLMVTALSAVIAEYVGVQLDRHTIAARRPGWPSRTTF